MKYIYETTPYGVKQIGDKFFVYHFAFGKNMSNAFDTRELAEQGSIMLAKENNCLVKVRIK